jgi:endonuclease III related protein
MPSLDDALKAVRTAMIRQSSPVADDIEGLVPFEAMVAVVLDRALGDSRWRAALDGLGEGSLLTPDRLANAEIPEIADALREKGVPGTAKTFAALKHLARWVVEQRDTGNFPGECEDPDELSLPLGLLCEELGAIKGIGPVTADAIVLFALKRPSYPVDRASFRVLVRHGWLDSTATYNEARDLLVERAMQGADELEEKAVTALSDVSYGMELLGRKYCRPAAPHCAGCPLEHLLPEGGPREVDA